MTHPRAVHLPDGQVHQACSRAPADIRFSVISRWVMSGPGTVAVEASPEPGRGEVIAFEYVSARSGGECPVGAG
ncbi:hypothetical protein [Luethyella okanaganae]|uniref:Uncharacterized protein n=1 Tax=Luethyella okanaganae TaxID=69372 RepID=A0ABW1VH80_9MICO